MVKSGARCGQEEEARNPVQESKWSIKVSGHGRKGEAGNCGQKTERGKGQGKPRKVQGQNPAEAG